MKQETQGTRSWYAIHTYAGYENVVLRNLKQRIDSLGMNDKIFNVIVPVEKKIKMLGVDMCSPDHSPFPIHKILLANNILILENLTNLSDLENKEFKVHAFPIKLQIDGSPVRVVAEIC